MDQVDRTAMDRAAVRLTGGFARQERALLSACARAQALQEERARLSALPITILDFEQYYLRSHRLGEIAQELARIGQ